MSEESERKRRIKQLALADGQAESMRIVPKKILIADDEVSTRLVLRKKLNDCGYKTIEAANGIETWNSIRTDNPDLVIMDMKMPGMHGLEILKKMRTEKEKIPVIIYSAYSDMMNSFTVMTYPNQRFLVKPTDLNTIIRNIEELIG